MLQPKTKFNYCVAHLPPEIAALVRDIILRERTHAAYEDLKAAITERCGESSTSEIRKLLTGEQLGSRKPSELLRVMSRRTEKYNVSDSLLLELFMHQMPPNVQSILASVEPLDSSKAGSIVDRILEVTPAQVSEVSSRVPLNVFENSKLDSLLKEVYKLRSEVLSLSTITQYFQNRYNRKQSPSAKAASNSSYCWYHHKYSDKAKKFVPPCTFQGNVSGKV
ncbi:uncharacterized protein LOC118190202 [Stegodyphus dumicola]|uniref:uncharacterized protein LOC118190202 n=1 Tax=Stegodyphus dumicola TaxID=202533 RepID=UPI0015AD32BF|nr:uncharacterized protein LOC118190202 [Stegodyphus dumicola]